MNFHGPQNEGWQEGKGEFQGFDSVRMHRRLTERRRLLADSGVLCRAYEGFTTGPPMLRGTGDEY